MTAEAHNSKLAFPLLAPVELAEAHELRYSLVLSAEIMNLYVDEVQRLAKADTTTETSYYPAISFRNEELGLA
jgi:hypothetical protein